MRERPHCTEYTRRPSETWTAPIGSQHARRQHRGPRCRWSATNRHLLFFSPPATAYPRICTRPRLRLTGGAGIRRGLRGLGPRWRAIGTERPSKKSRPDLPGPAGQAPSGALCRRAPIRDRTTGSIHVAHIKVRGTN